MKIVRISLLLIFAASLTFVLPACKAKKAVVKQQPVADTVKKEAPAPQPKTEPAPATEKQDPPLPTKPDLNFDNIQFEFNSAVLKTGSYQTLDKVAATVKMTSGTHFVLNGNSSAEGSAEHNMSLSVDRANSVKAYLVNAGVNSDVLTTKGYGESKPVANNTTEDGRALNRRVEIKVTQ